MAIECGPTIPQVLGNVVATISGGLIGYFSASRIARLNTRLAAGVKLRCAFAPELAQMRLTRTYKSFNNVKTLLEDAFPRHAAAIEEYRFFVRPKYESAYQDAWEAYYCDFLEYAMGEDGETPQERFKLFEQRVHAILRFTQRHYLTSGN